MPPRFSERIELVNRRRACVALSLLDLQPGDLFIVGDPRRLVMNGFFDAAIPDGVDVVYLDFSSLPASGSLYEYASDSVPSDHKTMLRGVNSTIPLDPNCSEWESLIKLTQSRRTKCYFDATFVSVIDSPFFRYRARNDDPRIGYAPRSNFDTQGDSAISRRRAPDSRNPLEPLNSWYQNSHPGVLGLAKEWGCMSLMLVASELASNGSYVVEFQDSLLESPIAQQARNALLFLKLVNKTVYTTTITDARRARFGLRTTAMLYGGGNGNEISFFASASLRGGMARDLRPFTQMDDAIVHVNEELNKLSNWTSIPTDKLLSNGATLDLNGMEMLRVSKGYELTLESIAGLAPVDPRLALSAEREGLEILRVSNGSFDSDGLLNSEYELESRGQRHRKWRYESPYILPYDILICRVSSSGCKPSINIMPEGPLAPMLPSENAFTIRLHYESPITALALYHYLRDGHGSEILALIGGSERRSLRWADVKEIEVPPILDQSPWSLRKLEEVYGEQFKQDIAAQKDLAEAKRQKAALEKRGNDLLENLFD